MITKHIGKYRCRLIFTLQQKTPLLACEDLIYAAAQGWQEDKQGRYRDDIAISVTDLEIE